MGKILIIKGADFSEVAVPSLSDIDMTYHLFSDELEIDSEKKVRFTTDGSTPTMVNSQEYSEPIDMSSISQLKVGTVKNNAIEFVPEINAEVSVGSLTVNVEFSASIAGEIRYTINSEEPTSTSTLYDNPIPVGAGNVIKAAIFVSGQMASEVCQIEISNL